MSAHSTSTNPVVQSIISGNAPPSARMAAGRGLLPLPQADLLEVLVHLSADNNPEIARAAQATLESQQADDLLTPLGGKEGRLVRRHFACVRFAPSVAHHVPPYHSRCCSCFNSTIQITSLSFVFLYHKRASVVNPCFLL